MYASCLLTVLCTVASDNFY